MGYGSNEHVIIRTDNPEITAKLAGKATKMEETFIHELKFFAHRGVSQFAPENTIPAYEMAGKMGFYGGECDIQRTSDGFWILMHDYDVDRMTNGTGSIANLTLAEIKAFTFDVGNNVSLYSDVKIPTFEEYLICCKNNKLVSLPEIKATASDYTGIVETLRKIGMEPNTIVSCFEASELLKVRALSTVKMQLLSNDAISQQLIDTCKSIGNCDLSITTLSVTQDGVNLAHGNGIKVNCWTVNSIGAARQMKDLGVDFITSDWVMGVY